MKRMREAQGTGDWGREQERGVRGARLPLARRGVARRGAVRRGAARRGGGRLAPPLRRGLIAHKHGE